MVRERHAKSHKDTTEILIIIRDPFFIREFLREQRRAETWRNPQKKICTATRDKMHDLWLREEIIGGKEKVVTINLVFWKLSQSFKALRVHCGGGWREQGRKRRRNLFSIFLNDVPRRIKRKEKRKQNQQRRKVNETRSQRENNSTKLGIRFPFILVCMLLDDFVTYCGLNGNYPWFMFTQKKSWERFSERRPPCVWHLIRFSTSLVSQCKHNDAAGSLLFRNLRILLLNFFADNYYSLRYPWRPFNLPTPSRLIVTIIVSHRFYDSRGKAIIISELKDVEREEENWKQWLKSWKDEPRTCRGIFIKIASK